MTNSAIITGVAGQTGSYLAELLLARGYAVRGLVRNLDSASSQRIAGIRDRLGVIEGNVAERATWVRLMDGFAASEIYHLASASSVALSWESPGETVGREVTSTSLAISAAIESGAHLVLASSSEVFRPEGDPRRSAQSPVLPRTPYGVGKAGGLWLLRSYRESRGLRASAAILFNHESVRRPAHFVTQKIAHGAAAVAAGTERELRLGNIDAVRDWGDAAEFAEALAELGRRRIQRDVAIGTGVATSVRQVCESAFRAVGLEASAHVVVDRALFRPADDGFVVADTSDAERLLGWRSRRSIQDVIAEMTLAALEQVRRGRS